MPHGIFGDSSWVRSIAGLFSYAQNQSINIFDNRSPFFLNPLSIIKEKTLLDLRRLQLG